jgi:Aerotolerance regulator N-terminal/von Willebrand factor type A domain
MTFVYPLLLGGLLLAGLPVLLHFLARQKPKTLVFPAFRFLLQKQRSNSRNLRLRHLLLLLLRIALIVLICLALARPRLLHESIGISKEKPIAMVLVIDTSPSMDYKSGDTTRLDLAKKRCIELLDQLPEDGRVLILDAADPTSFAREDWLKSLEKARQRVSSLTIRPDNAPVTKAIAEAWRRFDALDKSGDDAEGQAMPRFVCVFSDRTKASWESAFRARPAKDDAATVQMLYFDVGVDEPIDLAILQADLPSDRTSFSEGEKFRLRVAVKATGQKATSAIIVHIDGKEHARQPFTAEADKPETVTLDLDTAGLEFGTHQIEVKLATEDDALSFNNRRFLTFEMQSKQKILVLAKDIERADYFARALKALRYDVNLTEEEKRPDFAGCHAVFVVGVPAPADALWKALADYVQQGNGVGIIPPGDDIVVGSYNGPLAQKVMPAIIETKIESKGAVWSDAELDHPFMHPFRRWFAHGGYTFVERPRKAFFYWKVKQIVDKGITVPVRYDDIQHDNPPAVVERLAVGKVLLLTTTMDERTPAWNDYDTTEAPFYLALTMMCAKHLCPVPASAKWNFQFGQEPPSLKQEASPLFSKYVLASGDFTQEIRFVDGRWTGERLPRAGNYTITGTNNDKSETTHRFSINIAGEESDLTRVPIADIEAVLGKNSLVPLDRRRSLSDTLNWDEPMELFPWLMIVLLFLLAIENLLANRFYRQEPPDAPLAA